MLVGVLGGKDDGSENLIYISILAALINTIVQLNKMILEAKQLNEDVLDYLYLTITLESKFTFEPYLHEWQI